MFYVLSDNSFLIYVENFNIDMYKISLAPYIICKKFSLTRRLYNLQILLGLVWTIICLVFGMYVSALLPCSNLSLFQIYFQISA